MASVIDSIRSVYQDSFSLLKLALFSALIFFFINLVLTSNTLSIVSVLVVFIILYFYTGFSCIIINNRISQNIQTLPALDINRFVNVATKGFIVSIPYVAGGYFITNLVVGLFSFEGVPQLVAIWILRFFFFSLMGTALINLSNKFDIKEAMSISKLLAGVADVLVYSCICVIIFAILMVFLMGPILYLIYNFYQIGVLFQYVSVLFFTIFIAVLSDYWGQLHYDIESRNNYY